MNMSIHDKKTVLLALLAGLASVSSLAAGVVDGAGAWQGDGTTYDVSGAQAGSFGVRMESRATDAHTLETRGTITLADGKAHTFFQKLSDADRGFAIESDLGNGGGYCFGNDLCESYIDAGNGHGYAITIVIDGKDSRRLLVTELEGRKAVRFVSEKISRTQ
jgi:hypothetical protein